MTARCVRNSSRDAVARAAADAAVHSNHAVAVRSRAAAAAVVVRSRARVLPVSRQVAAVAAVRKHAVVVVHSVVVHSVVAHSVVVRNHAAVLEERSTESEDESEAEQ
jgi:hypothetical protein